MSGFEEYTSEVAIYIPIWLDLLLDTPQSDSVCLVDLHSNMVRFIISMQASCCVLVLNLHSNMVRFIIVFP